MSVDTAMERLRAANPAPDTRLLRDESEDLTALLATTWQRSTNMQTQQRQKLEPVRKKGIPGWAIALAAAAAVLVLVGIASLISTGSGTEPADVVPVTPTTVAAQVDTVTTVVPAPVSPQMVQIEAFDFGYSGFEAEIVVGDALEMFNASDTEYHNMVVVWLEGDDTRTPDDFALLPIDEMDAEDRRFFPNGVGALQAAPGEKADRRIRLQKPGRYIAFDDVPQGLDAETVRNVVDPADQATSPSPPWLLDGGLLGYQHGMILEFFVIEE